MLKWLGYLITAMHSSHCFRETDHAFKLSHCNPPRRLGYSRTIPLAETFILFHNEVFWLSGNLFQKMAEVRAFLLDGSCIKHKYEPSRWWHFGELRKSKFEASDKGLILIRLSTETKIFIYTNFMNRKARD